MPVEEIEEEIEKVRPLTAVRLFTLVGALTGTGTGFFLTIWSSLKWELVTGGKAPVSFPPFVIIAFELTILFGGLATALAMLLLGQAAEDQAVGDLRPALHPGPLRRGRRLPAPRRPTRSALLLRGRGGGGPAMMKYVFVLVPPDGGRGGRRAAAERSSTAGPTT